MGFEDKINTDNINKESILEDLDMISKYAEDNIKKAFRLSKSEKYIMEKLDS